MTLMPKKIKKTLLDEESLELKGFLTFLILHELNLSSLCGDELAKKIGKRKGAQLTPGTIYPALKRLRKRKLISYRRNGRKKMYVLTKDGHTDINRLYALFGSYFYGLKNKILRAPVDPEMTSNILSNKVKA
jgi:DNA-binding PadR family transcriptional regulator